MKRPVLVLLIALLAGLAGCSGDDEKPEVPADLPEPVADLPEPVTDLPEPELENMPDNFARYSAEDFFASTSIFGNSFSADGSAVLTTTDETGIYNVYRHPLDESLRVALTQSDTDAIIGVSFFPDDERVLITSDQGGNELNHLYVREANGELHDLTPGKNLKAVFMSWTTDGSAFFVKTNERDARFFDLYRYQTSDYSREMQFQNDDAWVISAVTGDGEWIAIRRVKSQSESNIYMFNLLYENEPVLATGHFGSANHFVFGFTPDSKSLIYGSDGRGDFANEAWIYQIRDRNRSKVAQADRDITSVSYSRDGRYQLVITNVDGTNRIEITETASGDLVPLPKLPAGNMTDVRFAKDSNTLAFYINPDNNAPNLFVYKIDQDELEQVTQALNPDMDPANLVNSRIVRYKSEGDVEIPSRLFIPYTATADAPAPALIWVQGGPGDQFREGYQPEIQHLVNQGYVVFAVNKRGSYGYGKIFYHMDNKKHGEADLQDLIYAKNYLQSLSWVDKDRIGVAGTGYGGYLALAAMTFTDQFKVGIDISGVTNWERTLKNIPPWRENFRQALYDEMGDPAKHSDRHGRISPLLHAKGISRPVLIAQGANDPRVLQVESDEMVEAIRENDVPVEYLVFSDEGHGFKKKANRIQAQIAYLTFLRQHLSQKDNKQETEFSLE